MLIWLLGMIAVLAVSFTLIVWERGKADRTVLYRSAAQELATAVEMFDRLPPSERKGWIREPGKHGFRLSTTPPPPRAELQEKHVFFQFLTESLPEREIHLYKMAHPMHGHAFFIVTASMSDGSTITMRLPTIPVTPPRSPISVDRLMVSLIALVLGVALLTWFAVRIATRPLSELAAAARALGENPERPPLTISGPQEVTQAAQAFNQMQKQIQDHMADRTRILAAISHDLQTPITRLRLRAEMVDDQMLRQRILADLQGMQTLIKEGLEYARSMDDASAPMQPIDLKELINALCDDANDMGWHVSCTGEVRTPIHGHPNALRRALWNLIENGIKFGGKVDITLEERAESHVITICDHGPGLPAEELDKVFEPFYRTESSRNRETGGTGLGLAIVKNLLLAQRSNITLGNRLEGGLKATVTLPKNE